jgi:hypothetical protein
MRGSLTHAMHASGASARLLTPPRSPTHPCHTPWLQAEPRHGAVALMHLPQKPFAAHQAPGLARQRRKDEAAAERGPAPARPRRRAQQLRRRQQRNEARHGRVCPRRHFVEQRRRVHLGQQPQGRQAVTGGARRRQRRQRRQHAVPAQRQARRRRQACAAVARAVHPGLHACVVQGGAAALRSWGSRGGSRPLHQSSAPASVTPPRAATAPWGQVVQGGTARNGNQPLGWELGPAGLCQWETSAGS